MPYYCCCVRVAKAPLRCDVAVFMNTSEFGRAANTGTLLPLSSEGSRIFVQGVQADHDALMALISDPSRRAVLLYPCEGALTTDELLEAERAAAEAGGGGTGAASTSLGGSGRRLVVVLDGTWNCARKLLKCLPGPETLPRVRLLPHQCAPSTGGLSVEELLAGGDGRSSDDEDDGGRGGGAAASGAAPHQPAGRVSRSLLYPVRKYGGAAEVGRVCTLEAVVGLLRALGEADDDACDALLENLKARRERRRLCLRRRSMNGQNLSAGKAATDDRLVLFLAAAVQVKVDSLRTQKHLPAVYGTLPPDAHKASNYRGENWDVVGGGERPALWSQAGAEQQKKKQPMGC